MKHGIQTQSEAPYKRIRIFKNDLLEMTTVIHPAIPLFLWIPIIGILIYRSFAIHHLSVSVFLILGFSGLFVWTFVEYFLHRFVFHYESEVPWVKRSVYIMHGLHHDDAMDPLRLVMPPVPALIYAGILFFWFRLILGNAWVEPYFSFFLIGYLAYDYVHYYVHHFTPKTSVGRYLKKFHMVHHFADEGVNWGVSSPLWDLIFGTIEKKPFQKSR